MLSSTINKIYKMACYFYKLASTKAADLLSSEDKVQAASILEVSVSASRDEIRKAYLKKVRECHPDINTSAGADDMMKLINAAYTVMSTVMSDAYSPEIVPQSPFGDIDYPSYEDIAKMRDEMGREAFNKKYPGWVGELQGELGLKKYNEIYEGYDPDYNPGDDLQLQANLDQLWESAYSIIFDSIDLSKIEDKIVSMSMSNEEKKSLLDLNNTDYETLKSGLERLGGEVKIDSMPVEKTSPISKLSNKDLKRLKGQALQNALDDIIKRKEYKFSECISLQDILKYTYKYVKVLEPEIHFSKRQIYDIVYSDNFRDFIHAQNTEYYRNSSRRLLTKYNLDSKTDRVKNKGLASNLVNYFKSLGYDTYNFIGIEKIFEKFKIFNPEKYEDLINIANPIYYGVDDIHNLNKQSYDILKSATRPIAISDDLIKNLTEIVKKQLFSVFKSNGSLKIPNHVIGSLTFSEHDVKGEKIIVQLILRGHSSEDQNRSKEIILGAIHTTHNDKKVIIIKINEDIGKEDLFDALSAGRLELDIRDNLVHELTHAKDIGKEIAYGDPQIGYNRPDEVRAYMGELSRFHLKKIRGLMASGMSSREAFDKSISEDDVLKDIEPYLTDKNKRILLKGIWTYIVENIQD